MNPAHSAASLVFGVVMGFLPGERLLPSVPQVVLSTNHARATVAALLGEAEPLKSKAAILRNNLFAHRSAAISYSKAYKTADVTPNEMRDLTDIALKIVNCLRMARGVKDRVFNTLPLTDAEAMLKALAQHAAGDTQ